MIARRLAVLFFLAVILFNYPILSLFNLDIFPFGLPLLYIYVFSAWVVILILIALATRSRVLRTSPPDDEGDT